MKYVSVLQMMPEILVKFGVCHNLNHRLKKLSILPSFKKKLSANQNHYRSLLAGLEVNSLTVITKYYYFISFVLRLFRLSSSVYCFYYRKCAHSHSKKKKARENRSPINTFIYFFFPFQLSYEKMPLLAQLLVKTAWINHNFILEKLHLPQSVLKAIFTKDVASYKWGILQCLTIAKGQQRDKVSIHKAVDFTASISSHLFEIYLCFLMGIVTTSSSSFLLSGRKLPFFWIKNLAMTLTAALCCCFPFESHTWKRCLLYTDSKLSGTDREQAGIQGITLDGSKSVLHLFTFGCKS